jgi:uncharacterized membrane protein YoaK (UPF0700 family)
MSKRKLSLGSYLRQEISPNLLLEVELILLGLATGILDATTFPDYRIFVSNQTGNTVFLGVGALGIASNVLDLRNVAMSLSIFLTSGFIMGQIADRIGRTRRGWLLFSNAFQTILVFVAAALRWNTFSGEHGRQAWAIIAPLAFASGAQVAMARGVSVPEIPTAIVTSAYIDLLIDPGIFKLHNRPRNRRILFIAALMSGGFIGAASYRNVRPAFAILLGAIIKLGVFLAFFFNPGKPDPNRDTKDADSKATV